MTVLGYRNRTISSLVVRRTLTLPAVQRLPDDINSLDAESLISITSKTLLEMAATRRDSRWSIIKKHHSVGQAGGQAQPNASGPVAEVVCTERINNGRPNEPVNLVELKIDLR